MRRTGLQAVLAAAMLISGACAPVVVARSYPFYQAGVPLRVERATVESARPVTIQGLQTGAGAAAGMTAGMIAGSALGQGCGTDWTVFAGALLGGLLGAAAEHSASQREGVEVAVLVEDGRRVVVVEEAVERFAPGDEVELLTAPDGTARVQHPHPNAPPN